MNNGRRKTLFGLALLTGTVTGSSYAFGLPTERRELRHALYLDEPSNEGEIRFRKLRTEMREVTSSQHVELKHLPTNFFDTSGTASIVIKALSNKVRPVAFFTPNFYSTKNTLSAMRSIGVGVPVFFAIHSDPVIAGFAESMQTPNRGMTGITYDHKRQYKLIELARTVDPTISKLGILCDDFMQTEMNLVAELKSAAREYDIETSILSASNAVSTREIVAYALGHSGAKTWIAPDGDVLGNNNFEVVRELTTNGIRVISDYVGALKAGAIATLEPEFSSPDKIWTKQFDLTLRGYPVDQIPIEQPRVFRRSYNLDSADRFRIKLSRAQLASFDVLYSARNKTN